MSKYISMIILLTTGNIMLQTNMWLERTNIDIMISTVVGLCSRGGGY